jgi:hypothetical protein
MTRNTTGGNRQKKQKRIKMEPADDLIEGQMFGMIIRNMGAHFMVKSTDMIERIGYLTGNAKKGPRINEKSFVVIVPRTYEKSDVCDIIGIANPPKNIRRMFIDEEEEMENKKIEETYKFTDGNEKEEDKEIKINNKMEENKQFNFDDI